MRVAKILLVASLHVVMTFGNIRTHDATNCPNDFSEWKRMANQSNCPVDDGSVYHCMSTIQEKLVWFCHVPFSISSEVGCPVLNTKNGKIGYVMCFENHIPHNGCPAVNNGAYSSYQLYDYPGCYTSRTTPDVMKTTQRTVTNQTKSESMKVSDLVTNIYEKPSSDQGNFKQFKTMIIGIGVGLLIIVVIAAAIIIIILIRKNFRYRDDVYFFKYGQNFNRKHVEETTYDEIQIPDIDDAIKDVTNQEHELNGGKSNGDNDQISSGYISPIMQRKIIENSSADADAAANSLEGSSVHSYTDIIGYE